MRGAFVLGRAREAVEFVGVCARLSRIIGYRIRRHKSGGILITVSKPVKLELLSCVPVGEPAVSVPPLTDKGVLPVNIHPCTLDEVHHAFGVGNPHPRRQNLWNKFMFFISKVRSMSVFPAVYIDGSFTTDKGRVDTVLSNNNPPGDIDAILELPPPSPAAAAALSNASNFWIFDKQFLKTTFEVHLFFYTPGQPQTGQDILELFQRVKRDEALDRGLPVGSRKGILRAQL